MNRALSRSAPEMKPLANSDSLRSRSFFASLAWIRVRVACERSVSRLACWLRNWVRAASRSASDWRTLSSKVSGSMRARSWPFFTWLLKSTNSSLICPEICEPTRTVVTADSEPDAETTEVTLPRSTLAKRYDASPAAEPSVFQAMPAARREHQRRQGDQEPRFDRCGAVERAGAGAPWVIVGPGMWLRGGAGAGRPGGGQPFFAIAACCSASSRRSVRSRVSTTEYW